MLGYSSTKSNYRSKYYYKENAYQIEMQDI